MSRGRMIFLTGRSWSVSLVWQWFLCACLAGVILFFSRWAKEAVPNVEGLTQDAVTKAIIGAKLKVGTTTDWANIRRKLDIKATSDHFFCRTMDSVSTD
jgi:hypothetical protein